MRYSVLAIALAGSIGLFAGTEDQVRRSIPVNSSSRLVLVVDLGAIKVQPSVTRFAEVEVHFRGSPWKRAEFDRMLRDFLAGRQPGGHGHPGERAVQGRLEAQPALGVFLGMVQPKPMQQRKMPGVLLAAAGGVPRVSATGV
jgi:hypothetical protein